MKSDLDQLSVEELISGITYEPETGCYCCIHCHARFAEGEVYPLEGRFFEAKKAAEHHLAHAHEDRLEALLNSGSRYLPVTENQQELLSALRRGESDKEIAKQSGVSPSTVRHQRFVLREKAKQARLFLALYTLAMEKKNKEEELIPVHESAQMVDERFEITEAEQEKYLRNAFESLEPLRLSIFPAKEKKKVAILIRIAEEFERNHTYTEPEVNEILRAIFDDYVTLRRYLIEYGFLQRTNDCRSYWRPPVCAGE